MDRCRADRVCVISARFSKIVCKSRADVAFALLPDLLSPESEAEDVSCWSRQTHKSVYGPADELQYGSFGNQLVPAARA